MADKDSTAFEEERKTFKEECERLAKEVLTKERKELGKQVEDDSFNNLVNEYIEKFNESIKKVEENSPKSVARNFLVRREIKSISEQTLAELKEELNAELRTQFGTDDASRQRITQRSASRLNRDIEPAENLFAPVESSSKQSGIKNPEIKPSGANEPSSREIEPVELKTEAQKTERNPSVIQKKPPVAPKPVTQKTEGSFKPSTNILSKKEDASPQRTTQRPASNLHGDITNADIESIAHQVIGDLETSGKKIIEQAKQEFRGLQDQGLTKEQIEAAYQELEQVGRESLTETGKKLLSQSIQFVSSQKSEHPNLNKRGWINKVGDEAYVKAQKEIREELENFRRELLRIAREKIIRSSKQEPKSFESFSKQPDIKIPDVKIPRAKLFEPVAKPPIAPKPVAPKTERGLGPSTQRAIESSTNIPPKIEIPRAESIRLTNDQETKLKQLKDLINSFKAPAPDALALAGSEKAKKEIENRKDLKKQLDKLGGEIIEAVRNSTESGGVKKLISEQLQRYVKEGKNRIDQHIQSFQEVIDRENHPFDPNNLPKFFGDRLKYIGSDQTTELTESLDATASTQIKNKTLENNKTYHFAQKDSDTNKIKNWSVSRKDIKEESKNVTQLTYASNTQESDKHKTDIAHAQFVHAVTSTEGKIKITIPNSPLAQDLLNIVTAYNELFPDKKIECICEVSGLKPDPAGVEAAKERFTFYNDHNKKIVEDYLASKVSEFKSEFQAENEPEQSRRLRP
jgi:hypothetical protein